MRYEEVMPFYIQKVKSLIHCDIIIIVLNTIQFEISSNEHVCTMMGYSNSSIRAVGEYQTKQVRDPCPTPPKGVDCILRSVPEIAFNTFLRLLRRAALLRQFFPSPFLKAQRQPLGELWEPNNGKHLRSSGTKRVLMFAETRTAKQQPRDNSSNSQSCVFQIKGGSVRNCRSLLGILVCTIGGVWVLIALFAGFSWFKMLIWR